MSQLASTGLYEVRRALSSPSGHVAVINISDSNGEYRDQRWISGVRGVYPVTHKMFPMQISTGSVGASSGVFGFSYSFAQLTRRNLIPGTSTDDGTNAGLGGGLLTGLSGTTYAYPQFGLKMEWASEPTNPHFSRLAEPRLTHGLTGTDGMLDKDGNKPQLYANGDPTLGDTLVFKMAVLANEDGDTWSMETRTRVRTDEAEAYTANPLVTHGYATDATVAGTGVGLKVFTRSPGLVNDAPGFGIQIANTPTNEGARTGRQLYLVNAWFENQDVTDGVSFWTCSIGGWQTTDHMPDDVDGTPNTDRKYGDAEAIEWLTKCVQPGDTTIIRIQIGQNNVSSGAFTEGGGADPLNYKTNVEAIIARWRTICAAADTTPYFYLVAPQNTIVGGVRFAAIASELASLAAANSDVGFFDLRGALIDNGLVDGDLIMDSSISTDTIHTNQLGTYTFAELEWDAISTATLTSAGGLRSRDRSRER